MNSFLIIGNGNAVTYKEIFPLIKDNKIWWGYSLHMTKCHFIVPDDYKGKNTYEENGVKYGMVNNAVWFTNLVHSKRIEELYLGGRYEGNEKSYPKYDNYDAIEVSRVDNIPSDYYGVMGVPITFLDKYCPSQFEIVGAYNYSKDYDGNTWNAKINGKYIYKRILIRRK